MFGLFPRHERCFCPRTLVVFNPAEQFRTSVISVLIDSPDAAVVEAETGRPADAQVSAVWVEPSRASTEAFQVRTGRGRRRRRVALALIFPGFLPKAGLCRRTSSPVARHLPCDRSLRRLLLPGSVHLPSSRQDAGASGPTLPGVPPGRRRGFGASVA